MGSGVLFHHGVQGSRVVDSVFHDIDGTGIALGSPDNGIQNSADANAIWSTTNHGIVVNGAVIVRNNVVFNTLGNGIFAQIGRNAYDTMVFSHNTVVNTAGWAMLLSDWSAVHTSVVANNVLCSPVGRALRLSFDEGSDPQATNSSAPMRCVVGLMGSSPSAMPMWLVAGSATLTITRPGIFT